MHNYPPKDTDPYALDETEAAKFIGVSKKTLQNWRTRMTGPAYSRVSRKCIRYRKEDLKAFIDERVVNALGRA